MKQVTGTTKEAKKFIDENLHKLGKVVSIEHTRNKQNVDYQTTITGEDDVMIIVGGLGSGYDGEGPNGLITVLQKIGVEESTAQQLVKGNRDERHSFKHVL